jgi:hypothetical protein
MNYVALRAVKKLYIRLCAARDRVLAMKFTSYGYGTGESFGSGLAIVFPGRDLNFSLWDFYTLV